jgi:hypothetical protein
LDSERELPIKTVRESIIANSKMHAFEIEDSERQRVSSKENTNATTKNYELVINKPRV